MCRLPNTYDIKTRNGTTSNAIWVPALMPISKLRSILFFRAMETALN